MFSEEVEKMYALTLDVNKTAKELGVSVGKVRKMLITLGLWSNYRSDQIGKLYKEGLTVSEIAEKLRISEKTVNAYLPYSKGDYLGDDRSDNALRLEKMRDIRKVSQISDRVLLSKGDYKIIEPSSRDILVSYGFFQFNLSKLMKLAENKEKVRISLDNFMEYSLNAKEEYFEEPCIVLELRPLTLFSYEPSPEGIWTGSLVNLNNNKQILELKGKGEKYIDGYIFRMEEYFPYITEHLSSFVSYWNGKLRDLVGGM